MKNLFIFLVMSGIFFPFLSLGAEIIIKPEFNPICWKEEECIKLRKFYGASDANAKDGFLLMESPCNKAGYGKCLPAGVTKTQIKFGGQSRFKDLGEFILVNYNYLLALAGILAVIMIIIAGAQWATSGGNSEAIGSAKKRIGGALVGLLIAYLSYVILNTINPALVNLRLPQTFMIRPQPITFSYCSQSPSSTKFALAGPSEAQVTQDDFLKITEFPLTLADPSKFVCGQKYFIDGANAATCLGSFCGDNSAGNKICAPDFTQPGKKVYLCRDGIIAGQVKHESMAKEFFPFPSITTEEWEDPAIDVGETELWAVCEDGDTTDVGQGNYDTLINAKTQFYLIDSTIERLEEAERNCRRRGGLRGFVLMFEMKEEWDVDEEHLVGWDGGYGKDLGDEYFFERNVKKINKKFFLPLEQFKKKGGFLLDIEAASIKDIDQDADYTVYSTLFLNK